MAHYLDKKEQRDLKILEILYSEERWWSGEDLAKLANCSLESVLKSIENLTNLAPELNYVYTIESQKNRGSYLVAMPNCSYNRIESLYYRQTTIYQLIDKIFQEHDLTIENLMNDLFISKSTLYRKLKIVEEIFSENNLTLNKNTLTIEGSELYIREYYYVFYWSLVQSEKWPFRSARQEIFNFRINEVASKNLLHLSSIEKIQFSYRLAVNFIRHQKKCFIQQIPTNIFVDEIRKPYYYELSASFNQNVPPPFQEREIIYFCIMVMTYPYLTEESSSQDFIPVIQSYKENNALVYHLTTAVIDELCAVYSTPELTKILRNPKILFLLFSAGNYAILFPRLGSYEKISRNWKKTLVYFEKENPNFFKNLYQIMANIQRQENYQDQVMAPGYIFFTVYNIFNSTIDISLFEESVSVKLISAENPISEYALAQYLQRQVSHSLAIKTNQTRNDSNYVYDLFISDIALPANLKPLAQMEYIWDTPPTSRDIHAIQAIIADLIETKKA